MDELFADRITDVPQSFIREILKVTINPSVISFAGGLPNRHFFPVKALQRASNYVFDTAGEEALQYSNSEGFLPLREFISKRYKRIENLDVPVENILITTGSQQGLDLLGKTILNTGDDMLIEEPGYLGAIQAFAMYRVNFLPVPVSSQGLDEEILKQKLEVSRPKLLYSVPNFQNPSGVSYPEHNREKIVDLIRPTKCLVIQDDPYADLRFSGTPQKTFLELLPEQTIMLGSFSKSVAPGLRLGWMVAPQRLMDKLIIAKQASDLHSNALSQRILYQYLIDNDIDEHVATISKVYGRQKDAMIQNINTYFPKEVRCTNPDGGMFLWAELPEQISTMALFDQALKENVAFVPGTPFYVNDKGVNTMRLNFSCVDEETIKEGIKRLGKVIERQLQG